MPKWVKVGLGFVGALVVGALGNGLWELMRPMLVAVGVGGIDAMTLGIASLQDDLYVRAARVDLAVLHIRASTALIMGMIPLVACIVWISDRLDILDDVPIGTSFKWGRIGTLFLMVMATFVFVGGMRDSYAYRELSYLRYLQRLDAPFLSAEQRLQNEAELAGVLTKANFEALLSRVLADLKAHHVRVDPR